MREHYRYRYQAREVLTRQKVAKGDVLLSSLPFVYLVNASSKGLYCDHCLKKNSTHQNLQRCSGCKVECYCSKECQRGSWDIHRFECKNLQRIYPLIPPDTAKLIAKVILRLKTGGDQFEERITEKRSRKFKDLMNHYTDLKDDVKRQEHLTSLVVVLRKYLGTNNLPNEVELQGIFGRVCVNSFSITDTDMNTVGTGVYLAASIFDHSCEPNAYVTFDGKHLLCRSLVDWPSLDWNKVRISYIDVMNTTTDRLEELHNRYYFWCDCSACHNPERDKFMSSINCGNTACTAPIFIDENDDDDTPIGACSACGFNDLSLDKRTKYCKIANYCREQLEVMKEKYYLDLCQRVIEKQGDLFHKLNILRVRFLDAGFEAAIALHNWDIAIQYGTQNIEGLKFYYGEDHPNIGLVLLKLGKICSHIYRLQDAVHYLAQAEKILLISHGKSHPLYKEELKPLIEQANEELKIFTHRKKWTNSNFAVGS
ncbi:histone-lysine N-methyltransferase SMYD3-like isoform X2 [Panulirus ornatus]|uniref:histone-lysine N-methyltransferase SMYD3-like isoform X2 n=1 Tax=Panulirus ornatus TaxID=150431 RepID=UPI003A83525D